MNDILNNVHGGEFPEVYSKLRALEQAGVNIDNFLIETGLTEHISASWDAAVESYADVHFGGEIKSDSDLTGDITIDAEKAILSQYDINDPSALKHILNPFIEMLLDGGDYIEVRRGYDRYTIDIVELESYLKRICN